MRVLVVTALMLVIGWLLGYFYETVDPDLWTSLALAWMLACIFWGIGWIAKRLNGNGGT